MQNVIDKIEWMFAGLGGFLGWFFGGFDGFLYALVVFVVCDYFTGVLAAAIKANPHDYSKTAWLTARKVPPLCSGWDAEKFFDHSAIHRIYLEEIFMTLAKRYGEAVENEILF